MGDARFSLNRIRNRRGLETIKSLLLPDIDYGEEELFETLVDALEQNYVNTYIAVVTEHTADEPVLFMIAVRPPKSRHVFIHQAWASALLEDTQVQDRVFLAIILWAQGFGAKELRMETTRCPKAFIRRWGFKPLSTVMHYSISDNLLATLVDGNHSKLIGVNDGIEREQTEICEQSDGGAAECVKSTDAVSAESDRTGTGRVRRRAVPSDPVVRSGGADPERNGS